MKKAFSLLITCLLAAVAQAQTSPGDLRMEKSRFYEGSQVLTPREVMIRLQVDPEAHALFKKAKTNYDASMVMGYVGGFLIGWPLGTALGGGEPEWAMAGAGAVVVLAAIPLTSAFRKHAQKAISIYNGEPATRKARIRTDLYCYGTGLRLTLRF